MITKKQFFIIWLLGMMSGFTLMISGNTLNFWLSKESIDIKTIGIFALVSMPYAINFIWAPIFDAINIPYLHNIFGKRLSWVIPIQIIMSIFVYLISTLSPENNLYSMAILAALIALFASAQDTILGAIRTEFIAQNKQSEISGTYVFGYRVGVLFSNYGAIYISQYVDWNSIYTYFSFVVFLFALILVFLSKALQIKAEDVNQNKQDIAHQIKDKNLFSQILAPIGSAKTILLILVFLILYKLPDNFISVMLNPFLLDIGYNEFEISNTGKLFGITCATFGGLFASKMMKNKNIYDSLLLFGLLHGAAHLMFLVQLYMGKNIYILFITTGFESISGGMAMTAYIAYIASLCTGKFRATQHAFFSSMMGLSRSVFPGLSGFLVMHYGWNIFFLFTSIASIPALILAVYLKYYSSDS